MATAPMPTNPPTAANRKPPGPPPPVSAKAGPQPSQRERKSFSVKSGVSNASQIIGVYGTGGIGKTELLANIRKLGKRVVFIDLERSTHFLDVDRIDDIETLDDLRDVLQSDMLDQYDAVAFDSFTKLEELAVAWTLANCPKVTKDKTVFVKNIEDYGFGQGYTYVYETFLKVLSDIDALHRKGKTVLFTCHDCTANVPNPEGEDWIRYEPRLQSPNSGKASIRAKVKEWADHLLFIGYDKSVGTDGKAIGSGTRTIYPVEMPTCLAKSRTLADPIGYAKGEATVWEQIFKS